MAIKYVGITSGNAINGGDITLSAPPFGTLLEGDLVIVAYSNCGDTNNDWDMAMVTSGYTEVADITTADGVLHYGNMGVFYKYMGDVPDTQAVVDGLGGSQTGPGAVAMVFRGVAPASEGGPFDVAATTAVGTGTKNPNPPSINTVSSRVWTVIAIASAHSAGTVVYTWPTGYGQFAFQETSNDSFDSTCGMAFNQRPADPEDPPVCTASLSDNSGYSWMACTMALKPKAMQEARPDGTTLNTWTITGGASTAHASINDWSDVTYIEKATTADGYGTLQDLIDPGVNTDHRLCIRNNSGAGTGSTNVSLYQGDPGAGGTLIATVLANEDNINPQVQVYNLLTAEADNITDYSNLYWKIDRGTGTHVQWIYEYWFEVPIPTGPELKVLVPVMRSGIGW